MSDEHEFLLQRVQPAMVGLIDGSLSTLAPIFAVVLASHDTRFAFIAGLATSIGAAISMGFSEALSDTGRVYQKVCKLLEHKANQTNEVRGA